MASIILRRRGLLALERAANKTSSLRWFSAEVNKNSEENSDTNTDGKIDFGKAIMSTSLVEILHSLCYVISRYFKLKSHVSPTSLFFSQL